MNDKVLSAILDALKQDIEDTAHSSMAYPKLDNFERGIQCGVYKGLQQALTLIDNILTRDDEVERKSK
jgi:hypothetical protein